MVGRPTDAHKWCSEQKDDCIIGIKISREYTETLDMNHCLKNLGNNLVQTPYSTDEKVEVLRS